MSDLQLALCPKCHGDGYIINQWGRVGFGIVTLGMGALIDIACTSDPSDSMFSYRCRVCKGKGTIDLADFKRKTAL